MKGIYALILNIRKDFTLNVGRNLKNISFKKGNYIYVGSALNSVEKRVQRHIRKEKKIHWHIDHLTTSRHSSIEKILYLETESKLECNLSQNIAKLPNSIPIKKFGSTDCKSGCMSHLYHIN
ncbi:MAG: GIY-YIG nuclease family protein [Nitrosopumilus sp.]